MRTAPRWRQTADDGIAWVARDRGWKLRIGVTWYLLYMWTVTDPEGNVRASGSSLWQWENAKSDCEAAFRRLVSEKPAPEAPGPRPPMGTDNDLD